MLVKELLEKLDSELDYIEIIQNGESESFSASYIKDENYNELNEYLDKEVKKIHFRTDEDYDESLDGEMYLLYTNKVLEIEVQ